MQHLVTFFEGIITFVSPCILPMLPIYMAYFAGCAAEASSRPLQKTLVNALGFVAGFTLLFVAMGAFASTVGGFFRDNQAVLNAVCGAIVIVLGLNYLGILRIPALQRTLKPTTTVIPRGFATSLLFGMVFAIGWTPCVGAFLGSALSLAASSGDALMGTTLLLCYSLGLGVPFIVSAVLIDRFEAAFSWVKSHYRVIDIVCGALLVVVGILMATGMLGAWLNLLAVR